MSYRILIVQILHTQESSDFRIISILLIFQSWESEQQSSANKVWIWICLARQERWGILGPSAMLGPSATRAQQTASEHMALGCFGGCWSQTFSTQQSATWCRRQPHPPRAQGQEIDPRISWSKNTYDCLVRLNLSWLQLVIAEYLQITHGVPHNKTA